MFGSEGGLDNGASPSTTLTFAAKVRDTKLDEEEVMILVKGGVNWLDKGWFRCARRFGQRAEEHGGGGILLVRFAFNPVGFE